MQTKYDGKEHRVTLGKGCVVVQRSKVGETDRAKILKKLVKKGAVVAVECESTERPDYKRSKADEDIRAFTTSKVVVSSRTILPLYDVMIEIED